MKLVKIKPYYSPCTVRLIMKLAAFCFQHVILFCVALITAFSVTP